MFKYFFQILIILLLITLLLPSCRTPEDDVSQTDTVTTEPVVPSHHPIDAIAEEGSLYLGAEVKDFYIQGSDVYCTVENRIENVPSTAAAIPNER